MNLADLSSDEVRKRLTGPGLFLEVGPYLTSIRSTFPSVHRNLEFLYRDFRVTDDAYADFHVSVDPGKAHRRWFRPQSVFHFDGVSPFKPLPRAQAFAMLEWGLNWCFGNYSHQYLIVHAAVIARGEQAIVMPAPPGSGKSTLCAGLVTRGWRLLSDETALIRDDGYLVPVPRPVNLKNRSLETIREHAPEAQFGETVYDTAKGAVTHMRPPTESVDLTDRPAWPCWIIFPRYVPGAKTALQRIGKATTTMRMAENSFNYQVRGLTGFRLLTDLVDQSECFTFEYSLLDEAVECFAGL